MTSDEKFSEVVSGVEREIGEMLKPPETRRPFMVIEEHPVNPVPEAPKELTITEFLQGLDVRITALFSVLDDLETRLLARIDEMHKVLR